MSTALEFEAELRVSCDSQQVNGKSILELMTLHAPCDAILDIRATGTDARALVDRLVALVQSGFGETD